MKTFSFQVGKKEIHTVTFEETFWLKKFIIRVDGNIVIDSSSYIFPVGRTQAFSFSVGQKERHEVRIDIPHKILFPGFRKTPLKVYVDGKFEREINL